jgi:hypothetical protein
LGLLLPDLASHGTIGERLVLYASTLSIGVLSIVETVISAESNPQGAVGKDANLLSLGGLALLVILALTWRILLRERHVRSMDVSINRPDYLFANPPATT